MKKCDRHRFRVRVFTTPGKDHPDRYVFTCNRCWVSYLALKSRMVEALTGGRQIEEVVERKYDVEGQHYWFRRIWFQPFRPTGFSLSA